MRDNAEDGYMLHKDGDHFTCSKCGCGEFRHYRQTVASDAKIWVLEYKCVRCGHWTKLSVVR